MIAKRWTWACIAFTACAALPTGARAQRADENATTSAEDAFGTRVGNENVGLYSQMNARGFSPQQAGNMRIEGLYYDQQGQFGMRLQRGQTMRIGLSAQSYPFPAPTGIADIALVMPSARPIVSVALQTQWPVGQKSTSMDVTTPIIVDRLGFAGGINYMPGVSDWRGKGQMLAVAGLFKWTPNERVEVIPLYFHSFGFGMEVQPSILPGGAYLPEAYDRSVFFGQHWAKRKSNDDTFGLIARGTPWENWRLQLGLFNSDQKRAENYAILFRNVQPDGSGSLDVIGSPQHSSAGTSGEVRLSGIFTTGRFRHTVHMATRGRDVQRVFGGTNTVSFGPATIGISQPVAKPAFSYGVRDKDLVRQISPGVAYVGQWANIGEFSVGLQKSFYKRSFGRENATPARTSSQPWLYNATAAVHPTTSLAVYAGYTRGLEEFGTAPDNAANRGEPVAAALTKQIDGGIHYRIKPGLSVIAGVFEVTKPYFDRDQANVYTNVGSLRHRGIETSLTGQLMPGLTVVAGAVFLQARVSGLSVDRGLIGRVPPGNPPAVYLLNLQYGPASWEGLSVDAQLGFDGSHYANRANTFRIPSASALDLGGRYSFRVLGQRVTLRGQIRNVTNAYEWTADGASGRVAPTAPRRYSLRLAADF